MTPLPVAMPIIQFAGSDARFECDPADTLLRAGLRAGLGMPYECNVGSCGTCKIEIVAGDTLANWAQAPALTERDRSRKRVLGCQARPVGDCTIKLRLRDECRPAHAPMRFRAALTGTTDLTHDIREFRFKAAGDAPAFLPGQYALFEFPEVSGLRAYSMSNIAGADGQWHFQARRVQGGAGSAALFDRLRVGESVALDGPYGMAYLRTDSPRDILCVAGGSGLAPMLSIARGLVATPALAARKLHFFYGARTPRDVCGESLLARLPGFGERITYTAVVSSPVAGDGWQGATGFVHDHVIAALGAQLEELEIYFAGPPAMAQALQGALVDRKIPYARMHYDSFY